MNARGIDHVNIAVGIGNEEFAGKCIEADGADACFAEAGHTAEPFDLSVLAVNAEQAVGSGAIYFFIGRGNILPMLVRQVLSPHSDRGKLILRKAGRRPQEKNN